MVGWPANNELKKIRKEAVMVLLKILFQNSSGGPRKTMNIIGQDIRFAGWDSSPAEHNSETISLESYCYVEMWCKMKSNTLDLPFRKSTILEPPEDKANSFIQHSGVSRLDYRPGHIRSWILMVFLSPSNWIPWQNLEIFHDHFIR
jgi:hypothetical protein